MCFFLSFQGVFMMILKGGLTKGGLIFSALSCIFPPSRQFGGINIADGISKQQR